MDTTTETRIHREPWNKGKLVGQKAPFKLQDIWALRVRLQTPREGRGTSCSPADGQLGDTVSRASRIGPSGGSLATRFG